MPITMDTITESSDEGISSSSKTTTTAFIPPSYKGGRPAHMHPSQDNQESLEKLSQTIEPRGGRDLAIRDQDFRQHEHSQQSTSPIQPQKSSPHGTNKSEPTQTIVSGTQVLFSAPAFSYPSQAEVSPIDLESKERSSWPNHPEEGNPNRNLDSEHDRRPRPEWSQSPPSSVNPEPTPSQRYQPYRPASHTSGYDRGRYPHHRRLSSQEQYLFAQDQSQLNHRYRPYHQRQAQQYYSQYYDEVLSQKHIDSQDHPTQNLEPERRTRRQHTNREAMGLKHDTHAVHHQATHSGYDVSPSQPQLDDYSYHRHHPPSPYRPHSAWPSNRTYSPSNLFGSDSSHGPRSSSGGEGTSPSPRLSRSSRVDRHLSLPNMESEDGSHSPRSGSNHTRPPFEASGDIPGTFRGSILLDQHGRPYYPDGRPLEPRTRGPYWAHPSLYDPRFDFYQRGYDYGYDHLYEIPRRRQAGHGMPPREFAPWEHKEEGRYPSHHHLAPWSERESSSTWTRRHSTDTIDETSQDPESQCHSHPLQQDIGEGTDGRDKDRSKMQDVEMKDSTAIYNSKSPSALDSQLLFRRYQSRTPEVCTVSEDPLARTHQESITENTKRTIKVSGSSPSVSTLSAPFSTDSSLSGNLPFVTHVAGNSSRLPPTSNDTTSEHSKSTSLSPSPANYFPSLHIGPSSVPSSDPHTVVSSAIESPDASNFVRRWSSSDSSSANPSCDTKEPRVRLGQEGYYNKHDLEELYKSWLAKFEASQKNKLTLAQSHQLHRQQHQNNQSQQSRLDGMRNANSPASSSKDAIEDGRDLPNADKRKVKWKTVEFNSSQLKQQSQEKGSGSSCGKSDDRGISMTKQDASKRLSGKRIRQDPAIDVDPDGISGDLKGNKDDNHDMDDIIEQKNQTIDEYTDNEEGGVSPGSNSGSASVESLDLVHENVTKNMADDTLVNVSSASSALFDGQSRRIRIQENKSHQCDKCDKKFSRPSQLLTHSFTHSGEKPHQCPHCQRLFNVASNLKRHIRIHSNNKRRSSRNGNVVFRSFAQGTHVTQMVTGTIGEEPEISGASGSSPHDPKRTIASSRRGASFDRLRWMNTETPAKSLLIAEQQQAQTPSHRSIKDKASSATIVSVSSTSPLTQATAPPPPAISTEEMTEFNPSQATLSIPSSATATSSSSASQTSGSSRPSSARDSASNISVTTSDNVASSTSSVDQKHL